MPDIPDLHELLSRYLPNDAARFVVPMGEGLDHRAWLVNGELVVRQMKDPDADAVRREVVVLEIAGRHATLPAPEVVFADADEGVLACRFLPGLPLMDMADADRTGIARQLGAFLPALHRIPLAEVEGLVPREDEPLQDWLDDARVTYPGIAGHLPTDARSRIEDFLAAPPPLDPQHFTFCHNDLGAEHILVDPATMRITGIIDWSDAAITDPVRDLALILRDLGPAALGEALAAYGGELTQDDRQRLFFHARCKLIEDLAYGLESGDGSDHDRYVDAALAHLDWTFGAV